MTREQAIENARQYAQARGWPWAQPIDVEEGLSEIYIRTNARNRGGNANIRVRLSDGSVKFGAFARR